MSELINEFIKVLFSGNHVYTWQNVLLYVLSGVLAGLVRLIIRNHSKTDFRSWLNDGSLFGAITISVAGALLFDSSFMWSFMGGYFLVYVLNFIEKKLDKSRKNKEGIK